MKDRPGNLVAITDEAILGKRIEFIDTGDTESGVIVGLLINDKNDPMFLIEGDTRFYLLEIYEFWFEEAQ